MPFGEAAASDLAVNGERERNGPPLTTPLCDGHHPAPLTTPPLWAGRDLPSCWNQIVRRLLSSPPVFHAVSVFASITFSLILLSQKPCAHPLPFDTYW